VRADKMENQLINELATLGQKVTELEPKRQQGLKLLKTLADRSRVGIYIVQDGKFRFINSVFGNYVGYSKKELLGMNSLNLVHPEDRDMVRQKAVEMLKGKRRLPYEYMYISKSGETKWVMEAVVSIPYEGNRAALGSFMDITEHKQTEEALKSSKEHFQALIENAFDTIMIIKADGSVGYVSPSIKQSLGYEPEEWVGKNLFEFAHPDDLQRIVSLFEEEIDIPDYSAFMELRAKHKDGSWRTIEAVSTNLLYHPSVAGIVCNFRDITDYRQKEKCYRGLIEDINDGYIIYQDDKIVLANRRFAEIFGYTIDQVLGKDFFTFVAPENQQEVAGTYIKTLSGREEAPERLELAGIKGDGTVITAEASIKSVEYDGKPAFSVIVRDTTERNQAEKELQALYEREVKLREGLEEERKRRIEFTRVLVHELRTPLTPVLASSDLLVGELTEGTLGRLARNISQGASDLSNRINDLMDLARGEIGTLQLKFESVDLLLLLPNIADNIAPMASSNRHSIILDLPQSLPLIQADVNRLQQVILNLYNNASKFTPSGGKITLRAREKDSTLIVEVQDTGCGISEEERQRLFEPYYRVERDRQRLSGLGLGLALCKTLVELHGGEIWVESCPDEGSTFSFSLPVKEPLATFKEGPTIESHQEADLHLEAVPLARS